MTTVKIKLSGLTLEVTGQFSRAERSTHANPGEPAYFEYETVTIGGVDITELCDDYIDLGEAVDNAACLFCEANDDTSD